MGTRGADFLALEQLRYDLDVNAFWRVSQTRLSTDLATIKEKAVPADTRKISLSLYLLAVGFLISELLLVFGVLKSMVVGIGGVDVGVAIDRVTTWHLAGAIAFVLLLWFVAVFIPGIRSRSTYVQQLQKEKRDEFARAAAAELEVVVRRLRLMQMLATLHADLKKHYQELSVRVHREYLQVRGQAIDTASSVRGRCVDKIHRSLADAQSKASDPKEIEQRKKNLAEVQKMFATFQAEGSGGNKLIDALGELRRKQDKEWLARVSGFVATYMTLARSRAEALFGFLPVDSQQRATGEIFLAYAQRRTNEATATAAEIESELKSDVDSARKELAQLANSEEWDGFEDAGILALELHQAANRASNRITSELQDLLEDVGRLFNRAGPHEETWRQTLDVAERFSQELGKFDREYYSYFSGQLWLWVALLGLACSLPLGEILTAAI